MRRQSNQVLATLILRDQEGNPDLDEVVTNVGKPSELYYLVRIRKSTTKDQLLTAVRSTAGDTISGVDVQLAEATQEREDKEEDAKS